MEGYVFVDFDLRASCDHNIPAIIFARELHGPAMVGHFPWNKCLRFSIVICLLISTEKWKVTRREFAEVLSKASVKVMLDIKPDMCKW